MRFGASSWPFQWDPPYEDTIRRVAATGFKAIELIAWHKQFLDEVYTPDGIRSLRKTLGDEGIGISQFVMSMHDFASPEAGKRAAALRDLLESGPVAPDFYAYDVNALPTPVTEYARLVQGVPLFTWTVRTAKQRRIAANSADAMIFEGFEP